MKIFITLTILFWKAVLFGQDENFYSTDNFEVIKLNYKILDSNAVRIIQKNIGTSTPDFFAYLDSTETYNFAYYTDNKNQWTSISLTFKETNYYIQNMDLESAYIDVYKETPNYFTVQQTSKFYIDNLKQINIDKKGKSELVVEGVSELYGSGGGTGVGWLIIINVDSVPTQIFKMFYKCWEESFGDRLNNREGAYYNEYEREVTVSENGIIVAPLDKKKYPFDGCELTEIPSGTYVLDEGRIRKKK